jgi:hypothetical protein
VCGEGREDLGQGGVEGRVFDKGFREELRVGRLIKGLGRNLRDKEEGLFVQNLTGLEELRVLGVQFSLVIGLS